MSKLYFPDRAMKEAGFDQQTIEFFRGLFLRTGGSLDPTTLDALQNAVVQLELQDSELSQEIQTASGEINNLGNQINDLDTSDTEKVAPIVLDQMKRMERRINQLEDAQ